MFSWFIQLNQLRIVFVSYDREINTNCKIWFWLLGLSEVISLPFCHRRDLRTIVSNKGTNGHERTQSCWYITRPLTRRVWKIRCLQTTVSAWPPTVLTKWEQLLAEHSLWLLLAPAGSPQCGRDDVKYVAICYNSLSWSCKAETLAQQSTRAGIWSGQHRKSGKSD